MNCGANLLVILIYVFTCQFHVSTKQRVLVHVILRRVICPLIMPYCRTRKMYPLTTLTLTDFNRVVLLNILLFISISITKPTFMSSGKRSAVSGSVYIFTIALSLDV